MKDKASFENETELESTDQKIKQLTDALKVTKKDINNTLKLLAKKPDAPSAELYQEQLDNRQLER